MKTWRREPKNDDPHNPKMKVGDSILGIGAPNGRGTVIGYGHVSDGTGRHGYQILRAGDIYMIPFRTK